MPTYTSWKTWRDAEGPLSALLPADTLDRVRAAFAFAEECHGDQRRPTGVPYKEHLLEALEVAVTGAGVTDPDVLAAIALHDVVEDTPCTSGEIANRFGDRVAELVGWVTKPDTPPGTGKPEKAALKAAYLRALADAPPSAVLVKLSDRVSNVQELERMSESFQRRYHRETLLHILPLAEREPWFREWFARWRRDWRHLEEPEDLTGQSA